MGCSHGWSIVRSGAQDAAEPVEDGAKKESALKGRRKCAIQEFLRPFGAL